MKNKRRLYLRSPRTNPSCDLHVTLIIGLYHIFSIFNPRSAPIKYIYLGTFTDIKQKAVPALLYSSLLFPYSIRLLTLDRGYWGRKGQDSKPIRITPPQHVFIKKIYKHQASSLLTVIVCLWRYISRWFTASPFIDHLNDQLLRTCILRVSSVVFTPVFLIHRYFWEMCLSMFPFFRS